MTKTTLIDERTRPLAPKIEGLTPFQELHGKTLAHIHAMHLRELDELNKLVSMIEAGERSAPDLAEAISVLPMVRAYKGFGTLCGRECRQLSFHHGAEEHGLFPALREHAGDGLLKVLDRLAEEHVVIHAQIEALAEKAEIVANEATSERFAEAREALRTLDALVRSHFGYEEVQLADAIGFYEVPI
ncbi:hemerythrin domain-containing protein [Fulvimarina sp. MAC3]|uniref:hemerythrin domain-containing protein n=1 Tax=Fulvimarina sp. MAC3 TaxID=3148887 RepID=UPI0031FBEEF5